MEVEARLKGDSQIPPTVLICALLVTIGMDALADLEGVIVEGQESAYVCDVEEDDDTTLSVIAFPTLFARTSKGA